MDIPPEVAEAEGVPEDLDSESVGPRVFPDPLRRRIAGFIYLAGAMLVVGLLDGPRRLVVAGLVAVIALWHLVSAHPLRVAEADALRRAAEVVPFAIGHASASVGWSGWRSRPEWQVVVYDVAEPPGRRALVRVDAVSGARLGDPYVESLEP